jgi:uncharacterized membrane protein
MSPGYGFAMFDAIINGITRVFEAGGALVLAVGGLYTSVRFVVELAGRRQGVQPYTRLRDDFGRTILLALEILVAADIIRTLAVQPTLQSVGVLGLIVLIRTFLSFSLETEINGALPWRRGRTEGH